MRKLLCILLLISMVLGLAACAAGSSPTEAPTESQTEKAAESVPISTEASSAETEVQPTQSSGKELDLKVAIRETYDGKADGYTFRVGVGKEITTPKIGEELTGYSPARNSESVHDDLNIIFFAIEQDGEIYLTGALDCCNLGDLELGCKIMISLQTGVPRDRIHFAATHTHSGPITYGDTYYKSDILLPAMVNAAKEAIASLQWAEMGVSTVESKVGVNRRELNSQGEIVLGQDPDGFYDPTMTVISFRNHEGKTIGNMIHYGCHNTASGKNTEITRDWCGVMKDAVEELSGGPTLFFNGAQGDVGPRLSNGKTTGNLKLALELGAVAAEDAVKCFSSITEWKKDCRLKILSGAVEIPYEEVPSEEEIRAKLAALAEKHSLSSDEAAQQTGLNALLLIAQSNKLFTNETIQTLFVSLGDVAFVPSPFETFAEPILDIRAGSPYPYTLVISNSNYRLSYFPTEREIPRGGYEVRTGYWQRPSGFKTPAYAPNGTKVYSDNCIAFLKELFAQ